MSDKIIPDRYLETYRLADPSLARCIEELGVAEHKLKIQADSVEMIRCCSARECEHLAEPCHHCLSPSA
jgi:hypothetical protein